MGNVNREPLADACCLCLALIFRGFELPMWSHGVLQASQSLSARRPQQDCDRYGGKREKPRWGKSKTGKHPRHPGHCPCCKDSWPVGGVTKTVFRCFIFLSTLTSLSDGLLNDALSLVIPPLHRGCDLSASIVRPQNWPGRRWRQKGGRTVALVVQWWYTGRSDIAMDAMVAVKFWACSKQSHKGRRGGRSLTGRSKQAGGRHIHRRGGRMDAQWSAIGRPVKNTYCCEHCVSIWAMLLPSLYHHCASFGRPIAPIERSRWRPLCLHSATTATL